MNNVVTFRNKYYPIILFSSITYITISFLWKVMIRLDFNIVSVIQIIIIVAIVGSMWRSFYWFKMLVMIWGLIRLIGGALGLVSVFLYISLGQFQSIVNSKLVFHLLHFGSGLFLMFFFRKSVQSCSA